MHDLQQIAANLSLAPDGLWTAGDPGEVSYPEDGHPRFFAVEDRSFWFRHRNEVITAVVHADAPGGALFDIGGGNGFVALALQEAGIESVVVEPGAEGARHAAQRGLRNVVNATLDGAGFLDASVPAMGLFDVLEHVEDDAALLGSIHSALRPGGRLYLTVPTYGFLWSGEDDCAGHFRRYTVRSLGARLEVAGFEVTRRSYFFACLVPLVLALRAIPSRLGLQPPVSDATTQRAHALPKGLAGRALDRCLAAELARIRAGRAIPFGSSCIAVARKPA